MWKAYHVLCCLLLLCQGHTGNGDPIRPDFSVCGPVEEYVNSTGAGVNCCTLPELMRPGGPQPYIEWKEYLLKHPAPAQPRVRRPAHSPGVALNHTYLEQLHRGLQLMRSGLPEGDPRSLLQLNNLHCINVNNSWRQEGFPDLDYSVHRSWLFHPFHTWFTFFSERILAKLVGMKTSLCRFGIGTTRGRTFEAEIHAGIHEWLGDESKRNEDSGSPYSAVRDPLFFVHHASVDRIWAVWEDAELVRVTVADSLNLYKLMYTYEAVENPWISSDPSSRNWPLATGRRNTPMEKPRTASQGRSVSDSVAVSPRAYRKIISLTRTETYETGILAG